MSRFTQLPACCLLLSLCSPAFADTPPVSTSENALVAVYLANYEHATQANPVIVASDGTSMEIIKAIASTLTKLEYSDAILCVTDDATSNYHLDIRIGIAIEDGRAELFIGRDFPLNFAMCLADSLSQSGVKTIRLRPAKDFEPWASNYRDSAEDPFAASTIERSQDDPFK